MVGKKSRKRGSVGGLNPSKADMSARARKLLSDYHQTARTAIPRKVRKSTNIPYFQQEFTKTTHMAFANLRERFQVQLPDEVMALGFVTDEYLRRTSQWMTVQGLVRDSGVARMVLVQGIIAMLMASAEQDAKAMGLEWPVQLNEVTINAIAERLEKHAKKAEKAESSTPHGSAGEGTNGADVAPGVGSQNTN